MEECVLHRDRNIVLNSETKVIYSYIKNNKSSLDYWRKEARLIWSQAKDEGLYSENATKSLTICNLIQKCKDKFWLYCDPGCKNVYDQLFTCTMNRINWNDIAHWIYEDMLQNMEPEDVISKNAQKIYYTSSEHSVNVSLVDGSVTYGKINLPVDEGIVTGIWETSSGKALAVEGVTPTNLYVYNIVSSKEL